MPINMITLRDPSRADLVQAIARAMVYSRGTKRFDDRAGITIRIPAEKLIDGLASTPAGSCKVRRLSDR